MLSKNTCQTLIIVGTVLFLLAFSLAAHCSTSDRSQGNSLGVDIPYENPFIYIFGGIVDGAVVEDANTHKEATTIRFQPFGTFELYTESLMFCGNRADAFHGMGGPIVITYRRVAHEMVGGQACHELNSVNHVAADKDQQ